MPLPAYKPTRNSAIERFLHQQMSSYIVGILELVMLIMELIKLAVGDYPVKGQTWTVLSFLVGLVPVVFCILLLIGLFKKNKCFVKSYLIFSVVFLILLVLALFVIIFTPSLSLGVTGFFSALIVLLTYLLFFFVVYTYYIQTFCTPKPTNNGV